MSFLACESSFSKCVRPAYKLEVTTSILCYKSWMSTLQYPLQNEASKTVGQKQTFELTAGAGFICDKAPTTAVMLRDMMIKLLRRSSYDQLHKWPFKQKRAQAVCMSEFKKAYTLKTNTATFKKVHSSVICNGLLQQFCR
jgi:hypothetical protein